MTTFWQSVKVSSVLQYWSNMKWCLTAVYRSYVKILFLLFSDFYAVSKHWFWDVWMRTELIYCFGFLMKEPHFAFKGKNQEFGKLFYVLSYSIVNILFWPTCSMFVTCRTTASILSCNPVLHKHILIQPWCFMDQVNPDASIYVNNCADT